jgi:hypothetical protein
MSSDFYGERGPRWIDNPVDDNNNNEEDKVIDPLNHPRLMLAVPARVSCFEVGCWI